MTLLQLEYLLALDRHRHFRIAAESCHVTQPSLSMQIQKLEEELGVMLIDRNVRPIAPTEVGSEVIAQARIALAEADRIRAIVQQTTGDMSGELRIGILSTISPYLLPLVIAPFSRRYPKVSLVFEEQRAEKIVEFVQRDLLDAGLIASPPAARGIVDEPLFEEPFVGYASQSHRLYDRKSIRREDLHGDDLWLMSEGHCFRQQTLDLLEEGSTKHPDQKAVQFESGNLETLQRLVDRGYGMTLLPWLAVQGEGSHAPESVRPFEAPAPTRTVRLVYAEVFVKKQLLRVFAETVREAVDAVLP